VAFTDWIEGPAGLSDADAESINRFMKFPYMETMDGYRKLLADNGCDVLEYTDLTAEFAEYLKLYVKMVSTQLRFDVLRIIGEDADLFKAMGAEMVFMAERAAEGAFGRGRWLARKN
jgi:hypothetical protein